MHSNPYGRYLRAEDIRGLSQAEALTKLIDYAEQWKFMDEWKSIITYIIRNEVEPRQFDMLQTVLAHLASLSRETLYLAISQIYDGFSNIKTVGTVFLILWYQYQDAKSYDGWYLRREYIRFAEAHELYAKEIMVLEDVNTHEYPARLLDQIRYCVETLPIFLTRNR